MSLEGRTITIVEDDPVMGESLLQSLNLEGCTVNWVRTAGEAERWLCTHHADVVVCDIRLPDERGDRLFARVRNRGCAAAPFLFMTAYGDIDDAVSLMRAGAGDYVTKPFAMSEFLDRVKALLPPQRPENEESLLGVSAPMQHVARLLDRLASSQAPILFTGETGAGKEVCARYLHARAPGKPRPFMAVNCAAIPADMLESEIFGHEAGAFTGARRRHQGYAERAGSGILFLDEVGDLPHALQAKLLRLIEGKSFFRLGGETEFHCKARLIFATNANLERAVNDGGFREDLFYRINVVRIEVPPLRDRHEDITWLMDRFFSECAELHDTRARGISAAAEAAALAHDWPGNVRELRNRVERAVALSLSEWITPGDLFPETARQPDGDAALDLSLAQTRDAAERRRIERALAQNDGRIAKTAAMLHISRTTLWEKMRKLGLS